MMAWVGLLLMSACIPAPANALETLPSSDEERKPILGMLSSLFGGIKDTLTTMKETDNGERGLVQEKVQGHGESAVLDEAETAELGLEGGVLNRSGGLLHMDAEEMDEASASVAEVEVR